MDDKTFTDNKKTKKNEGSIKNKTISKVKLSKSDLQIRKRKNSKARSKSDVDIRSDHNYSKINSTVTLDPFEKMDVHIPSTQNVIVCHYINN